ncbi:hypothetical protein [Geodermatophilus sp. URMC 64]
MSADRRSSDGLSGLGFQAVLAVLVIGNVVNLWSPSTLAKHFASFVAIYLVASIVSFGMTGRAAGPATAASLSEWPGARAA